MKRYGLAFLIAAIIGAGLLALTVLKMDPETLKAKYNPFGTKFREMTSKGLLGSKRAVLSGPTAIDIYTIDFKEPGALERLKQRKFNGETTASIQQIDGINALNISSQSSAVLYYEEVDLVLPENAHIEITWKPGRFPSNKKGDYLGSKPDNDFGGQVYLLFKSGPVWSSNIIQYLLDNQYYQGQAGTSDYSDKVKLMVADSRIGGNADWNTVTRRISSDYLQLFGKANEYKLGGIGLMSDSDNTKTSSSVFFESVRIFIPSSSDK